jgi:mycoredoxin
MNKRLTRLRRIALSAALSLALALLIVDRYAAYAHRPSADATRVAIYTTAWCPYCARLRADLKASGVEYTEYDVEKSVQGALGFWALRGRGVPVSAIGPKVVYGYRVDQIKPALRALGYSHQSASLNVPSTTTHDAVSMSIPN